MPFATTRDNVRLHYEEAGSGTPLLFVHEFAGDWRAWEPQMRYFARRYRCVTFSFRGYHPSGRAGQPRCLRLRAFPRRRDRRDGSPQDRQGAHLRPLDGRLRDAQRRHDVSAARAVAHDGGHRVGLGTRRARRIPRILAQATAAEYDKVGSEGVAKTYGMGPARIPFEVKDPRGYKEFYDQFASHSAKGAASTLRGYQAGRPPIYEFEADIKKIKLPSLIICGDEDDACIEPSVYLKKHIATSGLAMFPEERPHGEHRGARAVQSGRSAISSRRWMRAAGAARDPALDPGGEEVAAIRGA